MNFRPKNRIAVHGHRGSRGTHPENTMSGFKEASDCGADFFEVDIHLTKEDIPIVFHDPIISSRVCTDNLGKPIQAIPAIREMTVAEILQYDCGTTKQASFPNQRQFRGQRIPTFEQVCSWMKSDATRIGINVEIKREAMAPHLLPSAELLASKVIELLKQYGLVSRCIVQSFDHETVGAAKKMLPELVTSCLFEDEADFLAIAKQQNAQAIGPHFGLVTPQLVESCHAAGVFVAPWTVNQASDWKTLIDMGVDAIITDYPRELLKVLNG